MQLPVVHRVKRIGIWAADYLDVESNSDLTEKRLISIFSKIRRAGGAFALVEVMIVVAIFGLIAALAIPGFIKGRKQSQARQILNEARRLDAAIDLWALQTGKKDGDSIDLRGATAYLKADWSVTDVLGNPYTFTVVGPTQVLISAKTKAALPSVGISWGPY